MKTACGMWRQDFLWAIPSEEMEYEAIGETGGDMSSWKHRTQKNIFGSGMSCEAFI